MAVGTLVAAGIGEVATRFVMGEVTSAEEAAAVMRRGDRATVERVYRANRHRMQPEMRARFEELLGKMGER